MKLPNLPASPSKKSKHYKVNKILHQAFQNEGLSVLNASSLRGSGLPTRHCETG
jgi:hypothetical protein